MFTAIIMVALLGATGLSVDIGHLLVQKAALQAVADAAAMDARFALGSSTACARATALAEQSATNNGFSYSAPDTMIVTLGTASPVGNVETFFPDSTCANPTTDTAVSVQVSAPVKYAFNPGSGTPSAVGYWMSTAFAGVSVGSSLASLSAQQSLLGPLINGLLGGNLTAAGYQGLATSNVTMGQLLAAAPSAGIANLQVGTVSQLLGAQLSYADLLQLSATALSMSSTDPTAATNAAFLDSLVTAVGALGLTGTASLGQLLYLALPGAGSAADASLNVLGLVTGVAEIANGDHAAAVSLGTGISLPLPTGATLAGDSVQASVISPPVVAYGPPGTAAQTSGVVILVDEQVTLPVTLSVGLVSVSLDVPLYLTAASATATIESPITCGPPSIVPIAVGATTLGGYLADLTPDAQGNPTPTSVTVVTATLLRSAPVLYASGQLSLTLASAGPQTLTFTNPPDPPPSQNTSGSAIAPNVDLNQLSVSGSGAYLLTASQLMAALAPTLDVAVNQIVGGLTTSVVQPLLDDLGAQAGIATVGNPPYPGTTSVACSGNVF